MGSKINWQSVKWPDGSTYEGLVKDNELCHVRGVFRYSGGDRYEGEYQDNKMDGFGVYVWRGGTIYRGQWQNSTMSGCGVKITKQPNGAFMAEEGQFVNDEWVGDVMACTVDQARAAAAEADIAAQMARVFEMPDESNRAGSSRAAAAGPAASLSHRGTSLARNADQRSGRRPANKDIAAQQEAGTGDSAAAAPSGQDGPRQHGGPLGFLAGLLRRR